MALISWDWSFFLFIYLFIYFNHSYITYITVTENNLSTVTSIATLLTFFVLYKYVRYSAIQYLKQYWLKSDWTNNYIEKKKKKQKRLQCIECTTYNL